MKRILSENKNLILLGCVTIIPLIFIYLILSIRFNVDKRYFLDEDEVMTYSVEEDMIVKLKPGELEPDVIFVNRPDSVLKRRGWEVYGLLRKIAFLDNNKSVRFIDPQYPPGDPSPDASVAVLKRKLEKLEQEARLRRRYFPGNPFNFDDLYFLMDDDVKRELDKYPRRYVYQMYTVLITYWRDIPMSGSPELVALCRARVHPGFVKEFLIRDFSSSITTQGKLPVSTIVKEYREFREMEKAQAEIDAAKEVAAEEEAETEQQKETEEKPAAEDPEEDEQPSEAEIDQES